MTTPTDTTKKPVRVWVDGCFDMMHFGHANALRQAKESVEGCVLVVGVHTDEEIKRHKGPTVMNEQERYEAVRACKWADEVVEGAPYVMTLATLDEHNCDFCVHGEDISVDEHGNDVYAKVKEAGRYRVIKRTEGISTTDLVGRMLLVTKGHHNDGKKPSADHASPYTSMSHYVPTTRKIMQFTKGNRVPSATDKVVYIDGGFDLFHVGHARALKQAREKGDFLIVGVHDDLTVNRQRGSNLPIMNFHERVMSVLSCRYVDEVIMEAPFHVTKEMIDQMNISIVVHGDDRVVLGPDGVDPYEYPKKIGIYTEIKSTRDMDTTDIISRIVNNRLKYEERNKKKEAKEVKYIETH